MWKMQPTDEAGTNGVKFKLTLSGATLSGVPANVPNTLVYVWLSINGGGCNGYTAPAAVADGNLRLGFTGADTTPVVPETAGGLLWPCGPSIELQDQSSLESFAVGGIRMGDDTD